MWAARNCSTGIAELLARSRFCYNRNQRSCITTTTIHNLIWMIVLCGGSCCSTDVALWRWRPSDSVHMVCHQELGKAPALTWRSKWETLHSSLNAVMADMHASITIRTLPGSIAPLWQDTPPAVLPAVIHQAASKTLQVLRQASAHGLLECWQVLGCWLLHPVMSEVMITLPASVWVSLLPSVQIYNVR